MNSEYREPIINRAIDVLHERGWSPRGARGQRGEVCVAIAINNVIEEMRVAGELPGNSFIEAAHDAHIAIVQAAGRQVGRTFGAISIWNDDHCQSVDEAIDVEVPALVRLP